jgi:dTDP-glucose pyrophosphorylase/CBS domain-containing protein
MAAYMINWRNTLLRPASTISEAIRVLEKDDTKIVLVVDESDRLLGTITDGDIRRGLLNGCLLEDQIRTVMNENPKVVFLGDDREIIRNKMENLSVRQMPVVDSRRVVHGLETLKRFNDAERRDNPVFIMAGGFGTRLRPLTDNIPKPMLKVGGKPILERVIEGFVKARFHEFYISTHYRAEIVRDYFGDGGRWGIDIHYVHEDEPLGTAGALGLLPHSMMTLPIVMINGDILTRINYANLLDFHETHNGVATVCVKKYEFQVPYGVVDGSNHEVRRIVEKPVQRFFVNAGIYVLNPSLLRGKDGMDYLDMPSFLESIISDGRKVTMFPVHEYWLDIGRVEEFNRAQGDVEWTLD